VAGCCECGDEPSGSCATELVSKCVMPLGVGMLGLSPRNLVLDGYRSRLYKEFKSIEGNSNTGYIIAYKMHKKSRCPYICTDQTGLCELQNVPCTS
jgi:hypothetical protein